MVKSKRALVSYSRPSIQIIHLTALVCPKFLIGVLSGGENPKSWGSGGRPQNFPMFPQEYVDGLWATKSKGVGLIIVQDFQPCGPDSPTSQKDGRHAIKELFDSRVEEVDSHVDQFSSADINGGDLQFSVRKHHPCLYHSQWPSSLLLGAGARWRVDYRQIQANRGAPKSNVTIQQYKPSRPSSRDGLT